MNDMPTDLHLEFVDEALRLVRDAEAKGLHLRILGSIAYRIQCPNNIHLFEQMARALTDVDFGGYKRENAKVRAFFMDQGYVPDDGVYHLSEGSRHIYVHPETKLNIDVFADELYFCHRIPFIGRLEIDTPTISTTDLLLEKMQIVEINLKDFKDTLVLLLEHPLGSPKDSVRHIDMPYIVDIMAKDWGFYYTFTTNLKRVLDYIKEFPAITPEQATTIRSRIDQILTAIENAPKSFGWKIRAKIGTRKLWYQEVSEKTRQM
ncbi:MAG: hypothetical protein SGJ07_10220 [Rhodospirillaceae bacterium]|nr:hypothetical protein [Rhodospirillaceae bacterium]